MAGYDPQTYSGLIGIFAGANISTYLLSFAANPDALSSFDDYQIVMGNDKDSLTTSVSYKLNLRGPSFAVQTFCSTSLVATHLASQSLLNGECDIALAGGVSVRVPTRVGYIYNDGGMESPDGHCRTFDAQAQGTLFGDGAGIVVLKRLSEALEDGDPICAVIKGSAINNDGSLKVSYTAPSVVGQTEVVAMALTSAAVDAETISYVEAHGTATELGDPIEMASLTKAFRSQTDKTGYCAIGSVKTNFGHLDRAAGISGLIKTILSLQHSELPPSLHYQSPNPEIDFEHSPFYVNTHLSPWKQGATPRRAGINSLGMGGTNAHVVLEEAPPPSPSGPAKPYRLLLLSARTPTALEKSRLNLLTYLQQHKEAHLDDIAYTLQVGRHRFDHRMMLMGTSREQVITALETYDTAQVLHHFDQHADRPVVFLFPGVGEQYPGMARDLYQHEALFRQILDTCCSSLLEQHGLDLRAALQLNLPIAHDSPDLAAPPSSRPDLRALLAQPPQPSTSAHPFSHTLLAQPAIFVLEYALARLFHSWGIHPHALLGYSLGEYVAACFSGVLSLDDALSLVVQRARLIAQLPPGAMLAVMLSPEQITPYLSDDLSLAALNSPHTCVLAGTPQAIRLLEQHLLRDEIVFRRIEASHPFHSHLLHPVREPLERIIASLSLQAPQIPYLSNVTGTWITAQEVAEPSYWGKHLCQTVRWSQGVQTLLHEGEQIFLEVGPGQSLGSFVRQHPDCSREQMSWILPTLPAAHEKLSASQVLLTSLGKLWLAGGSIDWQRVASGQQRKRVVLPTYPFEHQRYWHEGTTHTVRTFGAPDTTPEITLEQLKREEIAQWFYLPSWKQSMPSSPSSLAVALEERHCWLIFIDNYGIGDSLAQRLTQNNQEVITVAPGNQFYRLHTASYTINPTVPADYEALLKESVKQGKTPEKIIHLWDVAVPPSSQQINALSAALEQGFFSLLYLAQAAGNVGVNACQIAVISRDIHDVLGNETLQPEKATLLGPCKVIPLEYPNFTCRNIDLSTNDITGAYEGVINQLFAELCKASPDSIVALRNQRRWVQTFEPISLPQEKISGLREKGVYLITGGLGGIGIAMAGHLVHTVHARLALLSRSELPPEEQWPELLASQGTTTNTGRKIHQLQQLKDAGAEILVLSADVSDERQMRTALEQVFSRFGAIHGVIHAAGVPGIGLMQTKTPEMIQNTLASKVQGTLVLDHLLEEYALDFLIVYSSITSITGGGPGQVDYCAANAFLDAFAHRNALRHGRTLAINWGEWKWNAWEAGLSGYDPQVQDFFRKSRERFGINFDEGFTALNDALSCPLSQVIVSTQHFPTIVELSKDFSISMLAQKERRSRQSEARHTRPPLANSYIAPTTPLEQRIAEVWEEFLGIEQIGIHDNFFEMGGHSLIGTQIILRLRQIFSTNISAATLFESPTIAELATAIEIVLIDEIELLDESQVQ